MSVGDVIGRRLTFSGMVQGVGFRYWAVREAAAFAVTGYVRNLYDGSVEVVLEGPRGEVTAFVNVLRKGPPYGRVRDVRVLGEKPRGEYSSFAVKF